MTTTKRTRKKNTRQRAGTTHGWGSMKKHRGAGSRGGRGMAGTGKRGDQKKTAIDHTKYFGPKGFVYRRVADNRPSLNLGHLDTRIDTLVAKNKATKKGDMYTLDLHALGYKKLLATGEVKNKYTITVEAATEKAVEKITAAGGKVQFVYPEKEAAAPAKEE